MSDYIRVSFSANALKAAVNKGLDKKITALTKDKQLANALAREYGTAVTRFVPRSDSDVPHHLQTFYVSDGRVMWTRKALQDEPSLGIAKGDDIAHLLYEGPITGKRFIERGAGATPYGDHKPQAHWDDAVRPGTEDWPKFVEQAKLIIKDWISKKNNG